MSDETKTREELLAELRELRRRFAACDENGPGCEQLRRAEAGLRESNERFRLVLENSLDAAYRRDLQTDRYDYMSPVIERITGYTPAETEAMSVADALAHVHPDDLERTANVVERLRDGRAETAILEYRFRCKGGEYRWLADRFRVVCDAEGRPKYLLGIVRDVTEEKQAHEALAKAHAELERRVEQRTAELQAIYESMFDGLLIVDIQTRRFVRVNPAACRMTGYSEAELLSKSVGDIHPPDEVPGVLQRFQARVEGQLKGPAETRILRKDGTQCHVEIVANTLIYGGRPAIAAVFRDITERKRAQEVLRQSLEELRAIYDGIAEGIVVVPLEDPHPIRANTAICQMLGYSAEEMATLSPDQVHPPEAMPLVEKHVRTVADGQVARVENLPFRRKDGSVFYADVASSRILYGGRHCRISFLHDVTDRRRDQEALERERRALERLLQASDHERQLIAYEIHDGLAQELAGAIVQFQIYDHQKETAPRDARKAFEGGMSLLRQAHAEARRLISGVRPPILDESGVMAAIAHLVHDPAFETGPKIEFRSRVAFQRLAPVVENIIYRVVQEGLANARRHSKSKRVRLSLSQRKGCLRISIRDWGVGFDVGQVQENRFGLEGIRERARLLGGTCSIQSKPGAGTHLVVELPIVEEPPKTA
ncbi:MAG: PAS domain S-box protein [Thermoguttaceae bacterium]|jgi:PAS domain S-box-containing protein|nr:PAS domain S-box protein [Thermoguttaceae bacterium]